MQSSPPERAWQRPSSPAGSQYSLDLAALDLEPRSGASSPLPQQHIDRIRSEDIDGPSDFTVNMEGWFRGGTAGRDTMRSVRKGLERLREARDEGAQADRSMLTPHKRQDEEQSASHHTPSNSPPPESVFKWGSRMETQGEDVSEWDPYTDGGESTPEPPAHKQFLQPTVEDYYSELTPARMPSARRDRSTSSQTRVAGADDTHAKNEPSSPGRPSSETLSPVRSPARSPTLQRPQPRQFSSQSNEAAFEKQMQDLQARCKQLELLNAALSQAVDEERRMRVEEKEVSDRRAAEAIRLEQEMAASKERVEGERNGDRGMLAELRAKVERYESERDGDRFDADQARQRYDADICKLQLEAQRGTTEQSAKLRALEQDLELALRNRDDAEASERAMREELDQYHAEKESQDQDDLDRMQSDLTQIEDPDDRVHELEDELQRARSYIDKLQIAKKDAEEETSDARAELANAQRLQDETARTSTNPRRAVTVAEDLQSQLQKLREQLGTEQTAHEAELERLRNEISNAPPTDTSPSAADLEAQQTALNTAILERDALRDDLEAQQSRFNAAILERDDAQDALRDANDAIADHAAVSSAIDAKVSAAIAKREGYWRARLEASEREREVMVKALLRQWGREDVGVAEGRQEFEYRFAGNEAHEGAVAGAR